MKSLLNSISQLLTLLRSSPGKLPVKVLLLIRNLGFVIEIIKQWIEMNKKNGKGPQINKFGLG